MNSSLELLIDDIEESLWVEGYAPLHEFSWFLRGDRGMRDEDAIERLARHAYDLITTRHRLHLEWFNRESNTSRPTGPGCVPAFDTHRDFETTELTNPFLVLVPDEPEAVFNALLPRFDPGGPVDR